MKSKDVKVKARIAKLLLSFCFVVWGVTWVYAFIEDEWRLIAGFFKKLSTWRLSRCHSCCICDLFINTN